MGEGGHENEWLGVKGVVGAWMLGSPVRRVMDLVAGDTLGRLLAILELDGDEQVVDVGCGSGYYSLPLAARLEAGRLTCVDGSEVMLRHLRRRLSWHGLEGRVEVCEGEVEALPLDDESADVVLMANLLHELPDPEAALAEAARVLRPGGRAVVIDFADTPVMRRRIERGHHESAHGVWEPVALRRAMAAVGLEAPRTATQRLTVICWAPMPAARA